MGWSEGNNYILNATYTVKHLVLLRETAFIITDLLYQVNGASLSWDYRVTLSEYIVFDSVKSVAVRIAVSELKVNFSIGPFNF